MNSHFITGTGTGVGKTVLTATLVAAARADGQDVVPMKPVQTGATSKAGGWRAPDLDFCLAMSGLEPEGSTYRDMAPYCFSPPCSPHLAAREAGVSISLGAVSDAFNRLQGEHDAVMAEGAGGVLVPLDDTSTMLDLMVHLALPILVAASPRLGTLNHTLLTLLALRGAGLHVTGVVLVDTDGGPTGVIEKDNRAMIEVMGDTRVLASLPHVPDLHLARRLPEKLLRVGTSILGYL